MAVLFSTLNGVKLIALCFIWKVFNFELSFKKRILVVDHFTDSLPVTLKILSCLFMLSEGLSKSCRFTEKFFRYYQKEMIEKDIFE